MNREDSRRMTFSASAEGEEMLPSPLPENGPPRQSRRAGLSISLPDIVGCPSAIGGTLDGGFSANGSAGTNRLRRRTPQLSTVLPTGPQPPQQSKSAPSGTPGPAHSIDSQLLEVIFSPSSTRLYRQRSFTAIQRASPVLNSHDFPRSRSVASFGADDSATESRFAVDDQQHQHARTKTASSLEMATPVSSNYAVVHSPNSGLYVPVREPTNYLLNPVTPPFMPSSRNHSFFEHILSSSSSTDDESHDSICHQCRHDRVHNRDNADFSDANESPAAVAGPARPRGKRREYPVIENLDAVEEAGQSGGATAPVAGGRCCVHQDQSCGRRCRHSQPTGRAAERTRGTKEEAFDKAKDNRLRTSHTHSFNLIACGFDETQPLFQFEEIAEWQKYNFYIKGSYRSYYTTKMILKSFLGWHNESVNIWSHFAGFVAFVILAVVLFATTLSTLVSAHSMTLTRLTYAFFCTGSILCMFNSTMYHLFTGHRKLKIFTLMGRLDFIGITILIVASFFPPLYVMFHCNPNFRFFYTTVICLLGFAGIVGPWTKAFHDVLWLRTTVYVGMVVSGLVPALHSLFLYPIGKLGSSFFSSPTYGIILMFALYGVGVVFYVLQFPERLFPGQFDTFLCSHQLWHFFVLMAAMVHYCNVVSMYQVWQLSDGVC